MQYFVMQNKISFSDISLKYLSNFQGDHTDPEFSGLVFRVEKNQHQTTTGWYIRFQVHGHRFYRSIGTYPEVSLFEARCRADICRRLLVDCFDINGPFGKAVSYLKSQKTIKSLWCEWCESEKVIGTSLAAKTYKDSLARGKNHIFPIIGNLQPEEVQANDIATILNNGYESLKESTVKKLRLDINRFFKWCQAREFIDLSKRLPTHSDLLDVLLKRPSRRIPGEPHPALSQRNVSRFVSLLTDEQIIFRPGVLPLLFTLLTASRIGNVVGSLDKELTTPLKWSDLQNGNTIWIVSASNMKCGRSNGDHTIPLSIEAQKILDLTKRLQENYLIDSEYVFTNHLGLRFDYRKIPLLIRYLSQIDIAQGHNGFIDRDSGKLMHTHGLRSTFKTWGTDHGIDWTLTEIALHHSIDKLKYDRSKAITRRKKMMQQWSNYCFSRARKNWYEKALAKLTGK